MEMEELLLFCLVFLFFILLGYFVFLRPFILFMCACTAFKENVVKMVSALKNGNRILWSANFNKNKAPTIKSMRTHEMERDVEIRMEENNYQTGGHFINVYS